MSVAALEGSGSTRRLVEGLCRQVPEGPQIRLECTSHPQIVESCRWGPYIGIVPSIANPAFMDGEACRELAFIDLVELQEKKVELSCSALVRRQENSAVLREVLDHLSLR